MLKKISNIIHKLTPTQFLICGFFALIWIGAAILYLPASSNPGKSITLLDALFTSVSALCVTGLVVVDTSTQWSFLGQSVILLLIQIGGLGFMTIIGSFFLIMKKRIMLKDKIYIQESLNQFNIGGLTTLIKNIIKITFICEFIGAILLSFIFVRDLGFLKGIWYSVFHSISAFCNAGFDLMGNISGEFSSITYYKENIYVNLVLGILIVIGGLGFTVILDIIKNKKISKMSLHSKISITSTIGLIIIGSFVIFSFEFNNNETIGNMSILQKINASIFQSITSRTAGFNTVNLSDFNSATMLVFLLLMFIGASPTSTGGGIKTTTFVVFLVTIKSYLLGKDDVEIFKRRIPNELVKKTMGVTFLAIGIIIISTIVLVLLNPKIDTIQIIFEVVSAIATVGLSIGATVMLNPLSKIIIVLLMFMGRVGSLTILVAIVSKKNKIKSYIQYPEENIFIG